MQSHINRKILRCCLVLTVRNANRRRVIIVLKRAADDAVIINIIAFDENVARS